jgi:hypothetical protein
MLREERTMSFVKLEKLVKFPGRARADFECTPAGEAELRIETDDKTADITRKISAALAAAVLVLSAVEVIIALARLIKALKSE